MPSIHNRLRGVSARRTTAALRLFFLAPACVATVFAQAPTISTIPLPSGVIGPAVFDAAGNLFSFQNGPVTPGTYQTVNGGGQCLFSNGFFSALGPCTDAYVAKIDVGGNLVFGTWIGGNTNDATTALTVDAAGNIYLTGTTGGGFPTTSNAANGSTKAATGFAAKLSPDGTKLLYSTYLPDGDAGPHAIAIDAQGNAYIAGQSATNHAFVVKLNPGGSSFLYNVTLGGSQADSAVAARLDTSGNLIVGGQTSSADFPVTSGALQAALKGAQNLFLARLDPTGKTLYSTYLGGSGKDYLSQLQTDLAGNIYIAGQTNSLDFPTTPGSFEPTAIIPLWNVEAPAGFTGKLNPTATSLIWSTYVMSADGPNYITPVQGHEGVTQLAVSVAGDVYVALAAGAGFPTTPSAPQPCFAGGNYNLVVAHLDAKGAPRTLLTLDRT